ncbi:hypothetical protein RclHR1_10760004 [Rhizophagus clarus]|uniref:Uncharacterized protein n=1 Tax=Rhizophagus clarus TaxID=94130 RepID=A0A2Z6Q6Z2_9GLOM|nr:hypothetical protein RclHR1_10760004 [Rhizophagus clarus]GES73016.1 hypothetical protein RCL_jg2080.t1 [Rhizophagus clarus]
MIKSEVSGFENFYNLNHNEKYREKDIHWKKTTFNILLLNSDVITTQTSFNSPKKKLSKVKIFNRRIKKRRIGKSSVRCLFGEMVPVKYPPARCLFGETVPLAEWFRRNRSHQKVRRPYENTVGNYNK